MLAIRLQRNGRSGYPVYRIIVQEANRHPLSGRIVAQVGSFNPHTKATTLDKEQIEKYLNNGAQPSTRVVRILQTAKITLPKWVKIAPAKEAKAKKPEKLRKNRPQEPAAPASSAAADPEIAENPTEAAEPTAAETSAAPAAA